jgi:hypothetical protein
MRRCTSFLLSGSAAAVSRGRRFASSMLGVPFYKGQSLQGTEQAPGFIRRANLFQRLQNLGTLLRTLSCSQSARDMKVLVRYPDIRYHWDKLPS